MSTRGRRAEVNFRRSPCPASCGEDPRCEACTGSGYVIVRMAPGEDALSTNPRLVAARERQRRYREENPERARENYRRHYRKVRAAERGEP